MRNFFRWLSNNIVTVPFWTLIVLGAVVVSGASFEEVSLQAGLSESNTTGESLAFVGYVFLSVVSAAVAAYAAWQAAAAVLCGTGLLTVPKSQVRIRILWKSQLRFRFSPPRS